MDEPLWQRVWNLTPEEAAEFERLAVLAGQHFTAPTIPTVAPPTAAELDALVADEIAAFDG